MLYASPEALHGENLEFTRLALHAYSLKIEMPSGEERVFTAPLPNDFERASELLHQAIATI